jgi:hypothetical protein
MMYWDEKRERVVVSCEEKERDKHKTRWVSKQTEGVNE